MISIWNIKARNNKASHSTSISISISININIHTKEDPPRAYQYIIGGKGNKAAVTLQYKKDESIP